MRNRRPAVALMVFMAGIAAATVSAYSDCTDQRPVGLPARKVVDTTHTSDSFKCIHEGFPNDGNYWRGNGLASCDEGWSYPSHYWPGCTIVVVQTTKCCGPDVQKNKVRYWYSTSAVTEGSECSPDGTVHECDVLNYGDTLAFTAGSKRTCGTNGPGSGSCGNNPGPIVVDPPPGDIE